MSFFIRIDKNIKFTLAKRCLADIGLALFIIMRMIVWMIKMMIKLMNMMIIFIQDDDDDDTFFLSEYQEVCSGLTTIAGFYRYF